MAEQCSTHHKQNKTIHLTLYGMLAIGVGLMLWRVYFNGPSYGSQSAFAGKSFIELLGLEFWNFITGGRGFIARLGDVFWYFMIGNLFASYIRTYKIHIRLRKTLIKYEFSAIFLAVFIAVFSPLCSCGILTTVVTLLAAGLPWAPSMALLIAAPLMSPTTFFLTVSDLGMEWAVIRTLAACFMGIFAGLLTYSLSGYFEKQNLFVDGGIPEGDVHDEDYADERLRCTCREKFSNRIARKYKNKFIIYWAKFLEMNWMVGKYILVGIFVGCVVERYIPRQFISHLFGTGSNWNIVWVTFGTTPLFIQQTSASGILYNIKESLHGTMDNGAALAFLIGGPVTAMPAMTLLWAMFKKRVFVLYMVISFVGTILITLMFKQFVFVPNSDSASPIFAAVSDLPNGDASVLNKTSDTVQMLSDPDYKGMIALHLDVEGGAGVAFDAGLTRFTDESIGKYDNDKYIKNMAKWLETYSFLDTKKSILVYSTCASAGLDKSKFSNGISQVLNNPYKVTVTDKASTPALTPELLAGYNQLWIINGGANAQGAFTKEEVAAIKGFHDDGGSLLLAAGPAKPDGDYTQDVNQIASEYGVNFSGYHQGGEKLPISISGSFFGKVGEAFIPIFDVMKSIRTSTRL